MKLPPDEAHARLVAHDHGVLCTVHTERGVDAVPVVFGVDGDHLGVPIDTVKPKSSTRLRRERNLESDPRATLLVEQWDRDDWTQLWWARAEFLHQPDDADVEERLAVVLAERYAQYRDRPFARILVFRVNAVSGWSGRST